jgi:PBP1b-binding outer membrane lipoprotein LpoB
MATKTATKTKTAAKSVRPADEKRKVWEGKLEKTRSGLKKSDLMISPSSKQVISKAKYKIGVAQMKKLRAANKAAEPFKKGSSPKKSKK